MKLPDLNEFVNLWPNSLAVLREKVLNYFIQNNIQVDNVWFADIEIVFPASLDSHSNVQVVLFGGFLERVFESGNWPDKNYTFWCLSSKVRKVLVDLLGFSTSSIRLIPRYQLFERITQMKNVDLNSDLQIIYSGRLSSQKNIEMVLAFASILQERIHCSVEILLLGAWDNFIPKNRGRYIIESYKSIIDEFQKNLKFKKEPVIINHLNHDEWINLIKENSLMVNFSTFVCEDFGVSIAQAQNIGLPMILSKWGGHTDVEGENVLWVNVDDISESFTLNELVILKAQVLVEKFLRGELEIAKGDDAVDHVGCNEYVNNYDLLKIRNKCLQKYGNEMSLLGQDRMSLFASSSSGKKFFKDFATIFAG